MKLQSLPAVLLLTSALAQAQNVYSVGDVAVVEDTTGSIHANVDLMSPPMFNGFLSMGGAFCRDTAKAFYSQFPDQYDGVFAFTPESLMDVVNVQQGQPVRWGTDQGIGQSSWDWGSQFGSASKLSHCVFMGSLPKLPATPDGEASALLGLPLGITGVELMGHEYGHHWLLWILFDKNDGLGKRDLLRGYDTSSADGEGSSSTGMLNGHYSYYADSHAVMYGQFITDLGNGNFKLEGGDRKYNQMDQYLMGLRAPSDVTDPYYALDDGSGHGNAAGAIQKGQSANVNNMTRVDVSVDDVVRAMGPRSPAYPNAQSCWRVATILVVPQGATLDMNDVAKVDAYRQRFGQWFTWATDGRGTMDVRLNGASGCIPNDAGITVPVDAGVALDAGMVVDAGQGGELQDDAGVEDAGMTMPPLQMMPPNDMPMGPTKDETHVPIKTLKPGCGCSSLDVSAFALLALVFARRRAK